MAVLLLLCRRRGKGVQIPRCPATVSGTKTTRNRKAQGVRRKEKRSGILEPLTLSQGKVSATGLCLGRRGKFARKSERVGCREPGNLFDGMVISNPSAGRGGRSKYVSGPQLFPERLGFFFFHRRERRGPRDHRATNRILIYPSPPSTGEREG
jgi:hypothetical protein